MYNGEIKKEFIYQELPSEQSMPDRYEKIFDLFAKDEKELGKDICNFSVNEIMSYYRSRSYSSYNSIYVINRLMIRYVDWCIANGYVLDNTNHFLEVSDKEILSTCINTTRKEKMFITRDELIEDMKNILNPCDKFLALGTFEGIGSIDRVEFKDLTMDNIDGNIIHLPKRDLEISQLLVDYAKEAAETYDIFPFVKEDKEIYYNLEPSERPFPAEDNRIIKARVNATPNPGRTTYIHRLDVMLDRVSQVLNKIAYSFSVLRSSGQIDFIRQFYATDENCKDLSDILNSHEQEILNRYGKRNHSWYETNAKYLQR